MTGTHIPITAWQQNRPGTSPAIRQSAGTKPHMPRHSVGPCRNQSSLLHNAGQRLWEPSWEPFAVDGCGRLWTPVESKASRSGLCGRLWTPVDTAWRSTDQKVGGSSPSGRALIALALQGLSHDRGTSTV